MEFNKSINSDDQFMQDIQIIEPPVDHDKNINTLDDDIEMDDEQIFKDFTNAK